MTKTIIIKEVDNGFVVEFNSQPFKERIYKNSTDEHVGLIDDITNHLGLKVIKKKNEIQE